MPQFSSLFFKRITVTLISDTTGEKLEKIKFSRKETKVINQACQILGLTPDQIIKQALESVVAKP